jgi:hypothetical protein
MVKASAVDRTFSQLKMEARLGQFVARPEGREGRAPRKTYAKKPVHCGVSTAELYAKYQSEQTENSYACAMANTKARDHKSRSIESAKLRGRLKRLAIKLMDAPRFTKKWMYKATGKTLVDEIAAINKGYLKERQANHDRHRRSAWADWLRAQAIAGDKEALNVMRARDAGRAAKGNAFSGDRKPVRSAHAPKPDGVTKKGSIIYSCGATAVRDDGHCLAVSRSTDQEGLRAALAMEQERFGSRIAVRGSDAFREQIAAAGGKLDIIFDDKALELRRRAIVRESHVQAHRQRNTSGVIGKHSEGVCSETSYRATVEPATGEAAHTRSTMHVLRDPGLAARYTRKAIGTSGRGKVKRNRRSR